jgi:hypothetical protein
VLLLHNAESLFLESQFLLCSRHTLFVYIYCYVSSGSIYKYCRDNVRIMTMHM